MKKTFTLLMLICAFTANAQITGSEMPAIGDSLIYKNINKNAFDTYPTLTGINKVWDYQNIIEKIDSTALFYIDPATTTEGNSFPGATVAEAITGSNGHFFYKLTASAFYRTGIYDATNALTLPYDDELKLYELPFQFGTSFNDVYTCTSGMFGTFPAIIDNGSYNSDVEGSGTLRLPTGYFDNVYRIYYEENFTIKADAGLGYMGMVQIQEYGYEYWKAGHIKPLLTYYNTTTINLIQGGQTNDVGIRYNKHAIPDGQNPVGITEMNQEGNFMVSQITAKSFLVSSPAPLQNCSIDVFDILGNKVYHSTIGNNSKQCKIHLESLNQGIYLMTLHGTGVSFTNKLVLQ